jgi:hypothetical protein
MNDCLLYKFYFLYKFEIYFLKWKKLAHPPFFGTPCVYTHGRIQSLRYKLEKYKLLSKIYIHIVTDNNLLLWYVSCLTYILTFHNVQTHLIYKPCVVCGFSFFAAKQALHIEIWRSHSLTDRPLSPRGLSENTETCRDSQAYAGTYRGIKENKPV